MLFLKPRIKFPKTNCELDIMTFFSGLLVKIEKGVLLNCVREWQSKLVNKGCFVEMGGIIVGTFDGETVIATHFVIDDNATESASYIRLSLEVLDRAEIIAKIESEKNGVKHFRVGTWHVHPPGYGCQFSPTDREYLFLERILITTDVPLSTAPQVHVIFAGDGLGLMAYSMCSSATYRRLKAPLRLLSLDRKKLCSQINALINDGEPTGLLIDIPSGKTLSYESAVRTEGNYDQNNIPCFWKLYPYPSVPMPFETIFFENFYQKTKQNKFYYIRVSKPTIERCKYTSWVITRENDLRAKPLLVDFYPVKAVVQ